jgi:hypothetical protein
MKTDISDKPLFYFQDSRCQYSIEQLESLVSSGTVEPSTIVHTICLPFKASDVIQRIAPILKEHLVETLHEPTYSL